MRIVIDDGSLRTPLGGFRKVRDITDIVRTVAAVAAEAADRCDCLTREEIKSIGSLARLVGEQVPECWTLDHNDLSKHCGLDADHDGDHVWRCEKRGLRDQTVCALPSGHATDHDMQPYGTRMRRADPVDDQQRPGVG